MWIPFIGEAYLRACEYTCDRYAAYYTNNLGASKNALTMLAIGKKLYRDVNHDAYLQQIREESGFFAWLSEKLSTHPHLPKRINALLNWFNPEEYSLIKDNRRTQVLELILTVTASAAIVGAGFYAAYKVDQTALFSNGYEVEGVTEIMKAAEQGDIDQLEKLTSKKIDINAKDSDGATALHYALYADSYKSAELLLKSGANPNEKDSWGTPLVIAASYEIEK